MIQKLWFLEEPLVYNNFLLYGTNKWQFMAGSLSGAKLPKE